LIPTPECNIPQEPSPIKIVPYANEQFVIISQPDWAVLGGYIYEMQGWIRSAGPCLRTKGSDVSNPPGGIKPQPGKP
jgi:hypothetical protein